MNQTNWTAIIGAVAAAVIAVVQGFHGSAIGVLESDTMHKDTIQAHVDSIDEWQEEQDRRLEKLEDKLEIPIPQREKIK